MKRKLLYLVNPISGTRKKTGIITAITQATDQAGLAFSFLDTRADGNYSFLPDHITKEKITDLIVCGGDGSVSQVCSFLSGINVSVGIVPLGSGNGLALAAGIPRSINGALKIIFAGHSAYIDGFTINDKFSCMMCGIGNDAQVAHDFAKEKTRGLNTYLRLSALNYFKSKPYVFTLSLNNQTIATEAFFIVVANSNQFGNNVRIAPNASLQDGLLDIVIVSKMHKLVLPFALLQQIAGFNISKNKKIINFQTAELTLTNPDMAPVHIDGEPQASTENISIKIKPNAFRLLQPS